MQPDELGIVTDLQRRRARFAERYPSHLRRAAGLGPDVKGAKETRIIVDIATGKRVVTVPEVLEAAEKAEADRVYAELVQAEIDRLAAIEEAERVAFLAACAADPNLRPVTVREVLRAVSSATGFTVPQLMSHRRTQPVTRARHIVFWLVRELTKLSLPEIGQQIDRRDHATIFSGIRRFHVVRDTEPTLSWLAHPDVAALAARIRK